jgi:hypothetical protein
MFRFKKIDICFVPMLVIFFVLISTSGSVFAQDGWGRVSYEKVEVEEVDAFRPYVIFCLGTGNPSDESYSDVFGKQYMKYGGGFGLRYNNSGMELFFRSGVMERSSNTKITNELDINRNFYLSTNDIQLRVYNAPKLGSFNIPVGFTTGITFMKVDGGLVGISDQIGGSGFYFSPFIGVERQLNKYFIFSVEGEYAISKINFDAQNPGVHQEISSEAWVNEDGTSFWDNIGDTENHTFDNSGFTINFRLKFFIPRYTGVVGG